MTTTEAIQKAYQLQAKWVGVHIGVSYDLEHIRRSIRSEMDFNRQRPERCTLKCKRETHADSIMLGKISKTLGSASV